MDSHSSDSDFNKIIHEEDKITHLIQSPESRETVIALRKQIEECQTLTIDQATIFIKCLKLVTKKDLTDNCLTHANFEHLIPTIQKPRIRGS